MPSQPIVLGTAQPIYGLPILRTAPVMLIPVMTSATAPSGYANQKTVNTYGAWQAMGGGGSGYGWLSAGAGVPEWIDYTFGPNSPVMVVSYTLRPWNVDGYPDRTPKTWTLSGSNDGSVWTVLDTRTNYTFASSATYALFVCARPGSWMQYRLDITAINSGPHVAVGRFQLNGYPLR
jgi:hypothetical protein